MRVVYMLLLTLAIVSCKQKETKKEVAIEEPKETVTQENEWEVLFDGTSYEKWSYYRGGELSEPWKIEEGVLIFYPPSNRPEGESYNIVTNKQYKDFVLHVEWKIAEGGNSGIFWGVFEDEKFGQPYETGPEIQVLDDERHPDAKNGTTHQAGALYDMIAPSEKVVKPAGEWNTCILTVNHNTNEGTVNLNGTEIVKFPVHGEMWDQMVEDSKFNGWEGFGKYKTGKIGLQDHGDVVAFRNIKIKEL